jgi:hypothetical protein
VQAKESLSRETGQKLWRTTATECTESKEARTVEVFRGFPQGVRAKNFVEVEEV